MGSTPVNAHISKTTSAAMTSTQNMHSLPISLNAVTSKYSVSFAGTTIKTTVTDNAATATDWVNGIIALYRHSKTVVGLEVEWRPRCSDSSSSPPATLQLCIGRNCLILQLLYMDEIPQSVVDFLMNPHFTFVGIDVADDVNKLKKKYGLDCRIPVDIRDAAKARWPGMIRHPGLKDLAWEVCGVRMKKPKHVRMSDWEAGVLSEAQVEYACINAFASYSIGHKLSIEK